jgi:hypothetical protein
MDKFMENPQDAIRAELSRREAEREKVNNRYEDYRRGLIREYPGIEDAFDEMAKVAEADGVLVPESFHRQIWNEDPGVVINLYKRVEAQREIASLRKQNEELKKSHAEFTKKIDKATKARPGLNGKSGQASADGKMQINVADLPNLKTEELEAILNQTL